MIKMTSDDNINSGDISGDISVVISTYDDPIEFVYQCLKSLMYQDYIYEIIVVDSSKKDDIRKLCADVNNESNIEKIHYTYSPPKGLSDARNKGMSLANRDIIAFTDSDCIIDKHWAKNISISFGVKKDVAIVGGKVLPRWISNPNKILHNSAIAQGFYSLFDMGEEIKEVEQIFGGNFAVDKKLVMNQFFSTELGRGKGNLLGGEETQLCNDVIMKNLKIIYNPNAIVWHQIPEERAKLRWMWKRLYYGGINRAIVGGKPTPKTVNSIKYNFYDIIFLTIFILPYIYGFAKAKCEQMISSRNMKCGVVA